MFRHTMLDLYPLLKPLLWKISPETAHAAALRALRWGLVPGADASAEPSLQIRLWDHTFPNPVGLAAGFDKNAEATDALLGLGFGFIELGGVTPRPQPGNPQPRLFRLTEDRAIINRMGFNSAGFDVVASRLAQPRRPGIVGVNLGRNKDSTDAVADYGQGVRRFGPLVDFLVINVSSPNTPGLRALQEKAQLQEVLKAALVARDSLSGARPVLLVKIAPDLDETALADIAEISLNLQLDGIVVGNTTIARPASLRSAHRTETGGLSGAPLLEPSLRVLSQMYALTRGQIPLIGTGGVASGADAYAKIKAGASMVQLYSALIYQGPALIPRILADLAALLRRDGFATLAASVGQDMKR